MIDSRLKSSRDSFALLVSKILYFLNFFMPLICLKYLESTFLYTFSSENKILVSYFEFSFAVLYHISPGLADLKYGERVSLGYQSTA